MGKHRKGLRSGIYRITCIANGFYYYGRTRDITRRMHEHLKTLRQGKHCNPRLQNCFNKHGLSSFLFELVEPMEEGTELILLEQSYLDVHLSLRDCMNINPKAEAVSIPYTEARRKKQSENAKRLSLHRAMLTPEAIARRAEAARGRPCSEATKEKVRKAQQGRPLTDAHVDALKRGWEEKRARGEKGSTHAAREVVQLCLQTGRELARYPSAVAAAKFMGGTSTPILKAARGERQKGFGFAWRFVDEKPRTNTSGEKKGRPLSETHKEAIKAGWSRKTEK